MDAGAHQSRREARSARAWRTDLCDRALIEAKADLEATQNQGFTALMVSANNGHDVVARDALEIGSEIKVRWDLRATKYKYRSQPPDVTICDRNLSVYNLSHFFLVYQFLVYRCGAFVQLEPMTKTCPLH